MNIQDIKVCVLRIEGTNCEQEAYQAFKRLGARPEIVHLKQLLGQDLAEGEDRKLSDFHILMIPGGFSSGDYVRAGAIWAARMKAGLKDDMENFVKEGKAVLGICNGFQVLVELGLLPGFDEIMADFPKAVLTTNDSSRFECRPTLLKHENKGNCMFTSKIEEGEILMCPSAHAEGKLVFPSESAEAAYQKLADNDMLVFKYVDPDGKYAGYPWNPNGSDNNVAGICNPQGNVFGMMPHPERVMDREMHPDWTRAFPTGLGDGRVIFESVLEEIAKRF